MQTTNQKIASRKTAQGSIVSLWSDGAITWALGLYIKGSPMPKTHEQTSVALTAGWLVLGEVELYDDEEVTQLIGSARWAAKRGATPGEMRAHLHSAAKMTPVWTTLETDRDGRPTLQCWVLPRILWRGLAVWRERGKYSICAQISNTGTYEPTGFEFNSLAQVYEYLLGCKAA